MYFRHFGHFFSSKSRGGAVCGQRKTDNGEHTIQRKTVNGKRYFLEPNKPLARAIYDSNSGTYFTVPTNPVSEKNW